MRRNNTFCYLLSGKTDWTRWDATAHEQAVQACCRHAVRRAAMAVAANEANSYMIDGSFEMNYLTGEVNFRMTAHFENSMISKDLLRYFVFTACKTIDMYNDKFLFVTKNDMTAEQVIEYLH